MFPEKFIIRLQEMLGEEYEAFYETLRDCLLYTSWPG